MRSHKGRAITSHKSSLGARPQLQVNVERRLTAGWYGRQRRLQRAHTVIESSAQALQHHGFWVIVGVSSLATNSARPVIESCAQALQDHGFWVGS